MSFLEKIRPFKEAEAEVLRARYRVTQPRRPEPWPVRDFAGAVSGGGKLIAEIKFKSPSHPEFRQDIAPATLAAVYQRHGAAALSIVTDRANFGTSLDDIASLREASDLPVIAKDFIIDPAQVRAAWEAGADAILLIARMLDTTMIDHLLEVTRKLGLATLVECHDQADLAMAQNAGADLVGVNNRNLATLTTDLRHGGALLPLIPPGVTRVSESGLNSRSDILTMTDLGADAFLVGHALLLSRDPGRKVAELCGRLPETGIRVKVCGITNPADAILASQSGADMVGVIFADSPRRAEPDRIGEIRAALPMTRLCGVFMDQDLEEVADAAARFELDMVQLHGSESPGYCRELSAKVGLPLIKVLRPDEVTVEKVNDYEAAAYFMVDLPKGTRSQPGPAEAARAARIISDRGRDVFLAGALTPDNVAAGIRTAAPYAVDVASGVEKSQGVKDPDLVQAFCKETRT